MEAARCLYAQRGYDVPRSAIAKAAGVSQAVMYRHFPNRVDLALEVFEENYTHIDRIVGEGGDEAIVVLWDWLLERAALDIGFIETVRAVKEETPGYEGPDRLVDSLQVALDRARPTNPEVGDLQATDLLLAWRMAYGLVATSRAGEVTPSFLQQLLPLDAVRRLYDK